MSTAAKPNARSGTKADTVWPSKRRRLMGNEVGDCVTDPSVRSILEKVAASGKEWARLETKELATESALRRSWAGRAFKVEGAHEDGTLMARLICPYPPFPPGPFASKMYTPTGSDPFDFVLKRAKTLLGESSWNSLVPDADRLGKVMSEIRNDHALPTIIGQHVRDEISYRKHKMRNK